jgi:hypothetical protein
MTIAVHANTEDQLLSRFSINSIESVRIRAFKCLVFEANFNLTHFNDTTSLPSDVEPETILTPGGDAVTSQCLHPINTTMLTVGRDPATLSCIDVGIGLSYSLIGDEQEQELKRFRYIGRKDGTEFSWYQIPINTQKSPCGT